MIKLLTKEYKLEQIKKWQADNQEKVRGYKKKWVANNREYHKEWRANHLENQNEYHQKWLIKRRFGSLERYEEAMLKYDGWCAFACDKKAELVHHLDGKSTCNSPRKDVNNNLKNLLPLCKSCHMRLHKWKI